MIITNILPTYQNTPTFKSKEYKDDGIIGYDDAISKQRRNDIRKWQETYYTPYQSIYEKECNLSEYQMKQLLGNLMKKPKVVDYKKVTSIDAYNVKAINNNSYRGSTLICNPKALKTLKNAGIERIIDLAGYSGYDKAAKSEGLDYYTPEFAGGSLGVWEEEAFHTKEEMLSRETRYYKPIDFEKNKKYLDIKCKAFDKQVRRSVERFVDYIEVMQKGYCYIGCEYGTYRTDDYLLLNTVFNPKANAQDIPNADIFEIDLMKNLYKNLTPEDKKRMGWSKEFDENIPKRLNEKENQILELDREYYNKII